MATLETFERGEDIFRSATLYIDDTPADTANFVTIELEVRHKYSKVVMALYSMAAGTIDTPLPTNAGIITWIIERQDNTVDVQTGIYEYEVTTTELDADYLAGTRYRKFIGDCFILNP